MNPLLAAMAKMTKDDLAKMTAKGFIKDNFPIQGKNI